MTVQFDLERKDAAAPRLGQVIVRAAARWAVSGAAVALLTIALMAAQTEQQYPWFYAAWFLTVVVTSGLLGAFCTICSIPSR
jgi:hypothetical protein